MVVKEKIKVADILEATDGGWQIFRKELGNFPTSRSFRHPLRTDRNPSAAIVCRGGIWFLKDFAEEFPTMTAIQFVRKKYELGFEAAINKLAIEYGVKEGEKGEKGEYKPVEIKWSPPIYEESEISFIFEPTKWRKEHYEFWKSTGVTEQHCKRYDTYAVKEAFVNRARIPIKEGEVVWAYYIPELDKVKLYFPERKRGNRFKGNAPNSHIWHLDKVVKCQKLVVIKSMKDLLCNTVIFPCTVAVGNEGTSMFTPDVIDTINKKAKRVFISYGSDKQGVEQSTIITQKTGWGWVNPPKELLPDVNDTYSLEKAQGVEAWKQCLKQKNII